MSSCLFDVVVVVAVVGGQIRFLKHRERERCAHFSKKLVTRVCVVKKKKIDIERERERGAMMPSSSPSPNIVAEGVKDFPILFFRDVVVLPGSNVVRMPIVDSFDRTIRAFAKGREDVERIVKRLTWREGTGPYVEGIVEQSRFFVGVIQCKTIPIDGEEHDDLRENPEEYVGTVCQVVSYNEMPKSEIMTKDGEYWYVNEGALGTIDKDFSQDGEGRRKMCSYCNLIGTAIKFRLRKLSRQQEHDYSPELSDFYRFSRTDMNNRFEFRRQQIRAARVGTVVDLFQDGSAETKQSSRYLKKLDPRRANIMGKASSASMLKDALKCEAMVNRCGGSDILAESNNKGIFPYVCVANSPFTFCKITESSLDARENENIHEQRHGKALLQSKTAEGACYAGGYNIVRNLEVSEVDEGTVEQMGTTAEVFRHAKEEISELLCRACGEPFGNASKAIKEINPACGYKDHTIINEIYESHHYGFGASKIFFNPHLHECEILTADARWIYNLSPAMPHNANPNWPVRADGEIYPFRSFFEYYGWTNASCRHCGEHLGWKFECLLESESDIEDERDKEFLLSKGGGRGRWTFEELLKDEEKLPRIFFGFRKGQIRSAMTYSQTKIEEYKAREAVTDWDWNYRQMHDAWRRAFPASTQFPNRSEVLSSSESSSDDDSDGNYDSEEPEGEEEEEEV